MFGDDGCLMVDMMRIAVIMMLTYIYICLFNVCCGGIMVLVMVIQYHVFNNFSKTMNFSLVL